MLLLAFFRGDPYIGANLEAETTELGGFVEESTEQKLPDLGRCLYGQVFNDGENTIKGDCASLKEGVDGVGDLIDMDCIA